MWPNTRISRLLKVRYPIIQAGMAGGPSPPSLVAAVSAAGGLGTLGGGLMKPEDLRHSIQNVRKITDKPFAVNLFVPGSFAYDPTKAEESAAHVKKSGYPAPGPLTKKEVEIDFEGQMKVIVEERVPVFSFTFGIPTEKWIMKLRDSGVSIIGTATNVDEAKMLESAGVDAIVAQGFEAGGHRGTFAGPVTEASLKGNMVLLPEVVDAVHRPVIAAGGIMDGRGIVAALALGVEAVQLGTAFLTSKECGAADVYKRALLQDGRRRATVISSAYTGRPARSVYNSFINETEGMNVEFPVQVALTHQMRKAAEKAEDWEHIPVWAGQGFTKTRANVRAGDLLRALVTETEEQLATLSTMSKAPTNTGAGTARPNAGSWVSPA